MSWFMLGNTAEAVSKCERNCTALCMVFMGKRLKVNWMWNLVFGTQLHKTGGGGQRQKDQDKTNYF